MNTTENPNKNGTKEKRKPYGLIVFFLFIFSIAVLLLAPTLLPEGSTSSVTSNGGNNSSSNASSDSQHETSSSTTTSNSSSLTTSASSNTPSSSSTTTSTTSQPQAGARLTKLNAVGSLSILTSIKNGSFEYFVWRDDANLSLSIFSGEELIDSHTFGDVSSFFYGGQSMVAYQDGVLVTIGSMGQSTSYFFDTIGLDTTITNTSIIPTSDGLQGDIYLHKEVSSQAELHIIDEVNPSLSTKVINLTNGLAYYYFTDVYDSGDVVVDISDNFRILYTFNPSTMTPVAEFYTADLLVKFVDVTPMQLVSASENGIFVFDQMIQSVKYYNASGTLTTHTNSILYRFLEVDSVLIVKAFSEEILVYQAGLLVSTYTGKSLRILANSKEFGAAFILINTNGTGFATYSITLENGVAQGTFYGETNLETFSDDNSSHYLPQFKVYNSVSQKNNVGYYKHGWTTLETFGEIDGPYDAFIFVDDGESDVPYAVKLDPVNNDTANAFNVKLYNGAVADNTVLSIVLEDLNIQGVQLLARVNHYLILNVGVGSNTTAFGYVVDLDLLTYVALPESIWYMGNQMNDSIRSFFFENNAIFNGFSTRGSVSFDLADIDGTFFTTTDGSNDATSITWIGFEDNYFNNNTDLVYVYTEPFPNPNNEADISFYVGDMSLGLDGMTLVTTNALPENFFNQSSFILSQTSVYALGTGDSMTITTLEGPIELNGTYYIQNDVVIVLDEELNETVTNLFYSDSFGLF
jgi:hypothetical protein